MEPRTPNPWLVPLRTSRNERYRIVVFPYAGGGASAFRTWSSLLPAEAGLYGVQYPGREQRIGEAALADLDSLAAGAASAVAMLADRPIVLFGHSMGGQVAFETCRRLAERHGVRADHLFISAVHAPDRLSRRPLSGLPDGPFLRNIAEMGGTSPAVLESRELMDLFLPMLRADFMATEGYGRERGEAAVATPVTALYGLDDPEAWRSEVEGWRPYCAGGFELVSVEGDHFFMIKRAVAVVKLVRHRAEALLAAA